MSSGNLSERTVIFLVGAVQFVNVLDFMMVMPLGPDFALGLGIDSSQLAMVGGSYTAAAFVSGFLGSLVLERFDRRRALFVAMLGLVLGTAAGGVATGLRSLMAARLLAGFFGGPATSLALSTVADLIPAVRRGRALGAVMGAFSVASVLGVPAGLELARWGGWRLPFFSVAAMGLVVALGAIALLPPMPAKDASSGIALGLKALGLLLRRAEVRQSYLMTFGVMMAGFLVIPNFSAFFQFNLGYPREHMPLLYMAGGAGSFVMLRLAGRWIDRWGPTRVVAAISPVLITVVTVGFLLSPPLIPVLASFVLFMVAMSARNVSHSTLTSLVPGPGERARFMSIQSSVQHVGSAMGAFSSAWLLSERPDRGLSNMGLVFMLNILVTALLPFLFWQVERKVRTNAVG